MSAAPHDAIAKSRRRRRQGLQQASSPSPLKSRQMEEDHRRGNNDDQSRVIMKFDEKRKLLQAICDRRDQLFGPAAAKMKPAQKQALWEEVIETFRQGCPDSTADLSAGYVRGIFWQNLRKRTLAKKERAATDENVKFDELDELVALILGDKIINTPPPSALPVQNAAEPPSQVAYPNISDLLDSFYQFQQHGQSSNHERSVSPESPAPTLNNATLDYSRFTPMLKAEEERARNEGIDRKRKLYGDYEPQCSFNLANSNSFNLSNKRRKAEDAAQESLNTTLALARLANLEAQTARIQAETRLLELKYACECRRNALKPEELPDGRKAFVVNDVDNAATSTTTTTAREERANPASSTGDDGADHSPATTSDVYDTEE